MPRVALPDAEWKLLYDELRGSLDPVNLRMLTLLCGRAVESVTAEKLWPAMLVNVLQKAQQQMWLSELLAAVIADPVTFGGPTVAACARARAAWDLVEAISAPYSPRDPKSALLLFNRAPFVDRQQQRPAIDAIVRQRGERVLVIRGERGVGKSHLGALVRHIVEDDPAVRVANVRIDEMQTDNVGPMDIMSDLADGMGIASAARNWDTMAQEARQAEKLCRWFCGQTQAFVAPRERWVLVIDGIDHPKVSQGALDLIDRLTIAAARGELVNVGLLLIGLPTPAPAHVANDVVEHTLSWLTSADYREYVNALARVLGRNVDPAGVENIVEFVLENTKFPLGRDGMATVAKRLRDVPNLLSWLTSADYRDYVNALALVLGRHVDPAGVDAIVDFVLDNTTTPLGRDGIATVAGRLRDVPSLLQGT